MNFTFNEILDRIPANAEDVKKYRENFPDILNEVPAIITDYATSEAGSLVFYHGNSNEEVFKAKAKDATLIISNKNLKLSNAIQVKDSVIRVKFALCKEHRNSLENLIPIAVTGSIGKTTTKAMIYDMLSMSDRGTLCSPASINAHNGFCEAVKYATDKTKFVVMEMGLAYPGHFFVPLSEALKPQVCVITNIGTAHIENFKDQYELMESKLECASHMPKETGILIINGDDELLMERTYEHRIISYGIKNKNCDYYADNIVCTEEGIDFSVIRPDKTAVKMHFNIQGRHNVYNALVCLAIGDIYKIPEKIVKDAISNYKTEGVRQNVRLMNGQKVIADCFNASRESVFFAIDMLKDTAASERARRIFVFGDMLACGKYTKGHHEQVGEYASKAGIDLFVSYGRFAKHGARIARQNGVETASFLEKEEIVKYIRNNTKRGDVILFKSSHDMHLDEVIDAVYNTNFVVNCKYIVQDLETKNIILGRHYNEKQPIAGLVKIMTAITAIETVDNLDKVICIGDKPYAVSGNSRVLCAGDKISVRELLYYVLMVSSNEASRILAVASKGSVTKFIEAMNDKCVELGMNNTVFKNVSGIDHDEQFSTAKDMNILMRYALKNNFFKEIISSKSHRLVYENKDAFTITNTNKLMYIDDRCIGGKNGATLKAGECLSTIVSMGSKELLVTILGSRDVYNDTQKLIEVGFEKIGISIKNALIVFGGRGEDYKNSLGRAYDLSQSIKGFKLWYLGINENGDSFIFKGEPEQIKDDEWERENTLLPVSSKLSFGSYVLYFDDGNKLYVDKLYLTSESTLEQKIIRQVTQEG